ncbi:MAG: patatin-like phospholipase family protein [Oscillospiraceae bacterium]|nr:patatin-like phospholipase family protein [Oscillospiraceae bacterium]
MGLHRRRIGLALSGGGIRACVFHLGVLKYLAQAGLVDSIVSLSSVSGASLCVGMIFGVNRNRWPGGKDFNRLVLPKVREVILANDLQRAALWRLPLSPGDWVNRNRLLARMLEEKWGITGDLQDLPGYPYWEINCTTFETGKRFRIRRDFMGDHTVGYTQSPKLPISQMMAASAGYPALIGPHILKTAGMRWTKDKWGKAEAVQVADSYALWDGGVYDNLGLEALYKIGRGLDSEIDYLILSNASQEITFRERGRPIENMARLLEVAMSQVDALRSRSVYSSIISQGQGVYLKIGESAEVIAHRAGLTDRQAELFISDSLPPEVVKLVGGHPTTLRSPTPAQFDRILRHGYETAKLQLTVDGGQ